MEDAARPEAGIAAGRYERFPQAVKVVFLILCVLGILLAVHWAFNISFAGRAMTQHGYYYLLIAIFLSSAFLILPARKKDKSARWYDLVAAVLVFGMGVYFFRYSWTIGIVGWFPPTTLQFALGLIFCLLVLEGGRRMAGSVYAVICLVFGLYPLFAEYMPGILFGVGSSFTHTIASHAYGSDGITGLPAKVIGDYLIGFLVFAAVLIASGAGTFFLNLALGILGRFRGGPAKVAVVASGFFGSLSGSAISNVVATGSVTIPAMKRLGYPPHYAAAVESCASTGGMFMPPVMGAVAFVMCSFLSIEYAVVIGAAAVPAVLYYWGLLMQVDAYAAKNSFKGLPREEIPSLKKTIAEGWPFIAVFIFLVWGLIYMRWEFMAPWYATGLMLLLSFHSREAWMTPKRLIKTLVGTGTLICQAMAVILPIAFIVNGLGITGTACAFTAGLVHLGRENLVFILLLGVVACYILGMAGMLISAYVFLAVTLAPAIIEVGQLNVLAVHLFIIYYAMLSAITPPVAVVAFIAASMAGAEPMKTAWQAVRLGVVLYFIPFFFVFNPSLVLQGSLVEAGYLFVLCLVGILLIASGLEGYLVKVGRLGLWVRPLLVISGFLIAFPEWTTTIIGAILALFTIAIALFRTKPVAKKAKV